MRLSGVVAVCTVVVLGGGCAVRSLRGTVVATEWSFVNLLQLNGLVMQQTFFLRLADRDASRPRYVRLVYKWINEGNRLPREMFEVPSMWAFRAERDKSCDGPQGLGRFEDLAKAWEAIAESKGSDEAVVLYPISPSIRYVEGDTNEQIPEALNLPCYVVVDRSWSKGGS
jgi:hypothetical protein